MTAAFLMGYIGWFLVDGLLLLLSLIPLAVFVDMQAWEWIIAACSVSVFGILRAEWRRRFQDAYGEEPS